MALAPGTRLGPYQIVGPLGAGGMGEVYRAKDTRLEREVAVKVLSSSGGLVGDMGARFEREARAISALNHPHICALYDVGEDAGTAYLVMELVEGQTLADRLLRGPLAPQEALSCAEQVADALERAHRRGIAHRDLKPGNIMLTKAGAKLLDFGLAKPFARQAAAATLEATRSHPITGQGMLVGTFQYMAPEQIEGREADARSDIFSFGAVLYEMFTGKRAFEGKSQISVASAILERDPPPVSSLQPLTPPGLDTVVQTCLAKDPEARWQSAHDVKLALRALRGATVPAPRAASPKWWWLVAGAALLLAATAFFVGQRRGGGDTAVPLYRTSLLPPSDHSFVAYEFALSPDGSRLAFTGTSADGVTTLWIKDLSADSNQEFSGTEGATYPFWSPDGRYLAFFAYGKLQKLDTRTGALQAIATTVVGRGGAWGKDGTIVFVNTVGTGLFQVSASGGQVTPATTVPPKGGESHRWPTFLPDGRRFLFIIDWSERDGLYLASLDDPTPRLVASGIRGNMAIAGDKVFFVKDGTLYAQRLDLRTLQLVGAPLTVVGQELEQDTGFSRSGFTVAQNGALVYQSRRFYNSRLVWFDENGREMEAVGPPGPYHPTFSPDGRRLAFTVDTATDGRMRVHVLDVARGTVTQVDDSPRSEAPVWSPDGRSLAVAARDERVRLLLRSADGTGRPQVLTESPRLMPNHWSRDGRYLLYMSFPRGRPELWVYDFAEKQHRALDILTGGEGQISPDGKWISYTVGTAGAVPAIYVQPFPGPGPRVQVSTAGGMQTRWSPDGKTLYYISPEKELMAVTVRASGQGFDASPPRRLFRTRMHAPRYALFQYDISPDGKRFLINSLPREDAAAPLTLITDWQAQAAR